MTAPAGRPLAAEPPDAAAAGATAPTGRPGRPVRSAARERLVEAGFAAGWPVLGALPGPVVAAAGRLAADAAVRRDGPGVRRLRANLRRVLGPNADEDELRRLVGRGMRSYVRYWSEAFRLSRLRERAATTPIEGEQHLRAALAAGRGAVLALTHSGNWDAAAVSLIAHGVPFTTVAERLKPEAVYRRFLAYREALGVEVLPLTGGTRPAADVLAERLRGNGVVCLLGDRDLTRSGVQVRFFGEPARMPAGPALLAATTGAALLPVGLWFDGPGWHQKVHPPVPVPAGGRLRDRVASATQALADAFAVDVAAHPEDWHMLQRLWLADLPRRR